MNGVRGAAPPPGDEKAAAADGVPMESGSPRQPRLSPAATGTGGGRASDRLKAAVGQLLVVGFDGPMLPAELGRRLARREVGGVMLFRPNIETPGQVAALVTAVHAAAPVDATSRSLVAVDQEGGLVQRLRAPLTVWPNMMSVGAAGDRARTEQVGRALGTELAALGIGWDFAPVLDVHTNAGNPVIGNRAFGTTPEIVAAHALAFWRGLRTAGVLGCGKHFPGHGDTRTDSHLELPVVDQPIERLRRIELAPFAAAARAGMESLMTAHVLFPALDPVWPATLSRRILTELLREELKFAGVIVSDDLGMKAVADRYSIDELAVGAIAAGADVLLIREPAERQQRAFDALVHAAETDGRLRARIDESAARVTALKAACTVRDPAPVGMLPSLLGTPAHRALAESFATVDPRSTVAASPVADA